jgi:hypothetical protein
MAPNFGPTRLRQREPQNRYSLEALEAKAERSLKLAEIRELESLPFALGLATGR